MKITMIGTGYVGLTTGACFANLGNDVICLDIDENRIVNLNNGKLPFFEPGLKEMVEINVKEGRLDFTTDGKKAVQESDVIFITVGTPSDEQGRADLSYVLSAAETIGKNINSYKVIVDKSTVPVGTADKVKTAIMQNNANNIGFDVVSNPEFLREGHAINDFLIPDRIVIGAENGKAKEVMVKLYKSIERTGRPIITTDVKSAELIKYASNAMLATRISFMNELSHLCEKVGADVKMVAKGMGHDNRIGPRFLQAGIGYGGSCFPKDVKAIASTLKDHNCSSRIMDAIDKVNEDQKRSMLPKISKQFGNLAGKKIAVWGLAFKPRTDDMREAPSVVLIRSLLEMGAEVKAFDPVAKEKAMLEFPNIEYSNTPYQAVENCDALLICTEWDEFRELDMKRVKALMKDPNIFDGRNVYEPNEMKEIGFNYIGVGR
ncbi:MAG: UDP-glucose/GDP-mannose dehydrogenase family protein [Candidatus Woesearchaeota archaeon]